MAPVIVVLFSYEAYAVTCRSIFQDPSEVNKIDPIARSILLAPSLLVRAQDGFKFKTADSQKVVVYKVVNSSADLKKLMIESGPSEKTKELEALLGLEGRVWGAGTDKDLILGESGVLLWSHKVFQSWVEEYKRYATMPELRVLDLAFTPDETTALPQWLVLALNYQLRIEAEAHEAKSDVEDFLKNQQLGLKQEDVNLPQSLAALGFTLNVAAGNSDTILTMFGDPVVLNRDVGNLSNFLQIRSAGRRAYNQHKRNSFEGAVVTVMPLHFDYDHALELGFNPFESDASWSRVFVIGNTDNKDVWTYRSIYRVPVVQGRLDLLRALGQKYLNELDDTAYKNLIIALAAYPELLSSQAVWPLLEIPVRGCC